MKRTKITFEIEATPTQIQAGQITYIKIMRDGKQIGHIYSEQINTFKPGAEESGNELLVSHPYPHDDSEYCLNSIQICGFDKISEVWGCGPFHGKNDVIVHFLPDTEYYQNRKKRYSNYIQNKINEGEADTIQNFTDWNAHNI